MNETPRIFSVHGVRYQVTDVARAVSFYRDALGLQVRFESPYWSELIWGDATVAVHGREQAPSGQPGVSTSIGTTDRGGMS